MPLDIEAHLVDRDTTIRLGYLSDEIVRRAIGLQNAVTTFKKHPSYDKRSRLKAEMNALSGAFSIATKMIGYRELPDAQIGTETHDVRKEVQAARKAVEDLYK